MHRQPLLELLRAHTPFDENESLMRDATLRFVEENSECFERTLQIGHVTGSAWIVNSRRTRTVLHRHARLNRWLQPGGHCDGDSDVLRVARREAREETALISRVVSLQIFDLDVHPIPGRGDEPQHLHFDIRFLLEADDFAHPEQSDESHAVAWIELQDVPAYSDSPSILRMVEKSQCR